MLPVIASSTTSVVSLVAGIIGIIVGCGGILSVVIVTGRQKALQSSLDLFALANTELRAQVDAGREDRARLQSEFDAKLADERAECARVTGHLQGQLTVLTGTLGHDIASSVLTAVRDLSKQLEGARASVADRVDAAEQAQIEREDARTS